MPNKNLTLEQIKQMKSTLAIEIHEMVTEFQQTTGMAIEVEKECFGGVMGYEPYDWPFQITITGCF